jgi:hypothetical protein
MATELKTTNEEKLNAGMKSILNDLEVACDKLKLLDGNDELYNELQDMAKSLSTEVENGDYVKNILKLKESVKSEQLFYLNKTGISFDTLLENEYLETAANILLETGVYDYSSTTLFLEYMSMIEKYEEQKKFIDDVDERINQLKIVIEKQNDTKRELSNIHFSPAEFTFEPIQINPIKSVQPIENRKEIVELLKKIDDIEKKQAYICEKTATLKSEQKKLYHGLPPNMDQALMAVKIAEETMKSVSKELVKKLEK